MADYIVKDTELTSVANAIRTAGGTSSLLNFPNGFVNAINNIGGGSLDFSTATVTVNYVGDYSASSLAGGYINIFIDDSFNTSAISFDYGEHLGQLPVSALGTVNELKIPIYNGAKSDITYMTFYSGDNIMRPDLDNSSVVSGSAEITDYYLLVWGDCVVNLTLQYNE